MATKDELLALVEQLREGIENLSDEGNAGTPAEAITIPTTDDIAGMDKDTILSTATQLGLNVEGQKSSAVKLLLNTLAKVNADEETDTDEVNDLAETLGLTPAKKVEKTIEAIKEWVAALGTAGETSTETNDDAPAADDGSEGGDGGDAPAADADSAPADGADNVDRDDAAAAFKKFPDPKTMVAHLTAYNAKAATEIEFDAKKAQSVKDAYRQLVREMVDSSGEIAAWGVAYFRDNGAWCCGIELAEEPKVAKATKKQAGKCVVTGKVFLLNEDGPSLDEYKK